MTRKEQQDKYRAEMQSRIHEVIQDFEQRSGLQVKKLLYKSGGKGTVNLTVEPKA